MAKYEVRHMGEIVAACATKREATLAFNRLVTRIKRGKCRDAYGSYFPAICWQGDNVIMYFSTSGKTLETYLQELAFESEASAYEASAG